MKILVEIVAVLEELFVGTAGNYAESLIIFMVEFD